MFETVKQWVLEAARLALSAAIAAILGWLLVILNSGALNGFLPLTPEVNTIIIGIITTAVKSADRAVHENKDIKRDGILPF